MLGCALKGVVSTHPSFSRNHFNSYKYSEGLPVTLRQMLKSDFLSPTGVDCASDTKPCLWASPEHQKRLVSLRSVCCSGSLTGNLREGKMALISYLFPRGNRKWLIFDHWGCYYDRPLYEMSSTKLGKILAHTPLHPDPAFSRAPLCTCREGRSALTPTGLFLNALT